MREATIREPDSVAESNIHEPRILRGQADFLHFADAEIVDNNLLIHSLFDLLKKQRGEPSIVIHLPPVSHCLFNPSLLLVVQIQTFSQHVHNLKPPDKMAATKRV